MSTTTVTLTKPLKRGDEDVTKITLHEPNAGHLRGLSIGDVLNGKTEAVITLIPRISDPKITEAEIRGMNLRDIASMAGGLADFFLTEEEKAIARELLSQNA